MVKGLSREEMRAQFGTTFSKPSLAKQSEKGSSDINKIVARYHKTGILPQARQAVAQYIDAAMLPDYKTALNTVIESEATFLALPAKVRSHFDNDPEKFVQAFESELDEKTKDLFIEYGLMNQPVENQPENSPTPAGETTPNS